MRGAGGVDGRGGGGRECGRAGCAEPRAVARVPLLSSGAHTASRARTGGTVWGIARLRAWRKGRGQWGARGGEERGGRQKECGRFLRRAARSALPATPPPTPLCGARRDMDAAVPLARDTDVFLRAAAVEMLFIVMPSMLRNDPYSM